MRLQLGRGPHAVARELLADGAPDRDIAERLTLSTDTVKSHMKTILAASGCQTRTEFVTKVFRGRITLSKGLHTRILEAEEAA